MWREWGVVRYSPALSVNDGVVALGEERVVSASILRTEKAYEVRRRVSR